MSKSHRVLLCVLVIALVALNALVAGVGLIKFRSHTHEVAEELLSDDKGRQAVDLLLPWARAGDGTAQVILGETYAFAWSGVPKDDAKAIYWFRRCGPCLGIPLGAGEDPAAPHELAVAEDYANRVEAHHADPFESRNWLIRASNGGNAEAKSMLIAATKPEELK